MQWAYQSFTLPSPARERVRSHGKPPRLEHAMTAIHITRGSLRTIGAATRPKAQHGTRHPRLAPRDRRFVRWSVPRLTHPCSQASSNRSQGARS